MHENPTLLKEQEHLADVEARIDSEIRRIQSSMPYPGVALYGVASGEEDRRNLQVQKSANQGHYTEIGRMRSFVDSPYFGRIDIIQKGGPSEAVYIGKRALVLNKNILVSDWRSPIADSFRSASSPNWKYGGETYTVQLRRQLNISDAKLHEYFDVSTVETANTTTPEKKAYPEGKTNRVGQNLEINDAFLRQILLKQRNHPGITDIIQTIQRQQNTIMTRPIDKSLLVQGCAGSGKTMIMLHRLSYLLFNNKEIRPKQIRIITPSKVFSNYIWGLAKQLEFEESVSSSIGELYYSLIRTYDKNYSISSRYSKEPPRDFVDFVTSDAFVAKMRSACEGRFTDGKTRLQSLYNSVIRKTIDKDLLSQFRPKYSSQSDSKDDPPRALSRIELYLVLLFLSLVFGKTNTNERILMFDEGQDIGCFEYKLWRQVLPKTTVFNIYGDTKQSLWAYSMTPGEWRNLPNVLGGEFYKLEQNYRNTRQITDYCNKQFNLAMVSIGIDGPEVEAITQTSLIREIKAIKSQDRVCVIFKSKREMRKFPDLADNIYCKGVIADGKVSLMTVAEAKGLEFESVFVVDDGMNENERYVSYTRALRRLVLIR